LERQNQWPETPVVVICGPTATGKTAAAIALAERLGGEVVNADSMQVYCGMDIGTAKPTLAERQGTEFHLLDLATPDQQLTVADWKQAAEEAVAAIAAKGRLPIVCGGTGLYLRALRASSSQRCHPYRPRDGGLPLYGHSYQSVSRAGSQHA
jgi:tRNA dimethylallyltransferase